MSQDVSKVWKEDNAQQLVEALIAISDKPTMQNFLRDVMTEKEITEISARFEAARMLTEGKKYTEIVAATKLSSRTVARISEWLQNGCNGYQAALNTVSHHGSCLTDKAGRKTWTRRTSLSCKEHQGENYGKAQHVKTCSYRVPIRQYYCGGIRPDA